MPKKKNTTNLKKVGKVLPIAEFALKHEFYLESLILISNLFEIRLRTIISRTDKVKPGLNANLDVCLKNMKLLLVKGENPILGKHFEIIQIDEIRKWKNDRNILLKDFIRIHVSKKRLKRLAYQGMQLLGKLNNSHKKFKSELKKSVLDRIEESEKVS